MEYRYKIIRSARRTLSATIKDGIVIVRAPMRLPESEIIDFLRKHENWIQKNLVKAQEMEKQMGEPLTMETIQALAEQAKMGELYRKRKSQLQLSFDAGSP